MIIFQTSEMRTDKAAAVHSLARLRINIQLILYLFKYLFFSMCVSKTKVPLQAEINSHCYDLHENCSVDSH
jgi:hypothetical protein